MAAMKSKSSLICGCYQPVAPKFTVSHNVIGRQLLAGTLPKVAAGRSHRHVTGSFVATSTNWCFRPIMLKKSAGKILEESFFHLQYGIRLNQHNNQENQSLDVSIDY